MKRRDALKNTAFVIMGSALSASTIASIFSSCKAPVDSISWKPEFLSPELGQVVTQIADMLIPASDTPGAVDALVPQFIDIFARDILTSEQQKQFAEGYTTFEKACKKANGKSFAQCSDEQKLSFLKEKEKEFITSKDDTFFGTLKEVIYRGFFTSEEGMNEVLAYDPVPGNYDGCIPFSDVNTTWAI